MQPAAPAFPKSTLLSYVNSLSSVDNFLKL